MGICRSSSKNNDAKELKNSAQENPTNNPNNVNASQQENPVNSNLSLNNKNQNSVPNSNRNSTKGNPDKYMSNFLLASMVVAKNLDDQVGPQQIKCKTGTKVDTKVALSDCDIIGIYCCDWDKCADFTQTLIEKYNELKNVYGKQFEIICLCIDDEEDTFNYCIEDMPWYALPFSESEKITSLSLKYNLVSHPSLVIVDGNNGDVVNQDGYSAFLSDNYIQEYPFQIKPAYKFEESIEGLETELCLVILQEFSPANIQKENHDTLQKFSKQYQQQTSTVPIKCFSGNKINMQTTVRIRKELNLEIQFPKHKHECTREDNKVNEIWCCSYCPKNSSMCQEKFKCYDCEFMQCTECNKKTYTDIHDKNPMMFLINLNEGVYYKPQESAKGVTHDNMVQFLKDHTNKELTKSAIKSGIVQINNVEQGFKEDGICLFLIQDLLEQETQSSNTKIYESFVKQYKNKSDQVINTFYYANGGQVTNNQKRQLKLPVVVTKHMHELKQSELGIKDCISCEQNDKNKCTKIFECEQCNIYYCHKCYKESQLPIKEEQQKTNLFVQNFTEQNFCEAFGDKKLDIDQLQSSIKSYEDGNLQVRLIK